MTKSFIGTIFEAYVKGSRNPLDIAQYHGVVAKENVAKENTDNREEESKNVTD